MRDGALALRSRFAKCFADRRLRREQSRKIAISGWQRDESFYVARHLEPRKNRVSDSDPRYALFAVTQRFVARPESNHFNAILLLCAQVNHGMAVLSPTDCVRPKNLHEITRSGRFEGDEIMAESQLVKQTSCAWTIRIPATPDSDSVRLPFYGKCFR